MTDMTETDDLDALYAQWLAEIEVAHAYDLERHHAFRFTCELDGITFTSEVLTRGEARELLDQLEEAAIEDLTDTITMVPKLLGIQVKQRGRWIALTRGDVHDARIVERCLDCDRETISEMGEYYMVQFEMWQHLVAEAEQRGMLCVGCLEKRLGRHLAFADFTDAPVNDPLWGRKSARLLHRITDDGQWLQTLPEGLDGQQAVQEVSWRIRLAETVIAR